MLTQVKYQARTKPKDKKVVIIHNLLWTHYKAVVHRELYSILKHTDIDFHVLQVCKTRQIRANMGSLDYSLHNYPFTLLFDKSLEETSIIERAYSILRAVLKMKPDVLIVSYADKAYLPIIFLSKIVGIKLIMNFNSNEIDQERNILSEGFKRLMLKIPVNFFCYGTTQAKYVEKLGGNPKDITIRYQTTDVHKFHREIKKNGLVKREKSFLYVGRITKIKNLKFLIDVFASINQKGWALKLVGDGDQFEELKNYSTKQGLSNVYFLGGKTQEEVIQYYCTSSIFVLPSTMEPWGLVVNEAMICGLPILVSSNCGCCKDLLKEQINGFSFHPTDKEALAQLMQGIVNGAYNLQELGEKSKEIIADYTPINTANQMIAGIKTVLGNG